MLRGVNGAWPVFPEVEHVDGLAGVVGAGDGGEGVVVDGKAGHLDGSCGRVLLM